jgi:nicotinic acid phosphoribosyltransferase
MCASEVAQLRQQIELEMDAMRGALSGFALGTARHAFIQAKMERIGTCQHSLAHHIGVDAANQLVCSLYMETMEDTSSPVNAKHM